MVTVDFAKGTAVTVLAIGGLLLGFKVQDDMRRRAERDLDERVEREYQRRIAERAAKAAAAAQQHPQQPGAPRGSG